MHVLFTSVIEDVSLWVHLGTAVPHYVRHLYRQTSAYVNKSAIQHFVGKIKLLRGPH